MIKNPFDDEFFKENTAVRDAAVKETTSRLTFSMLGIPVGSELVYKRDPSVTCLTIDEENKVEYKGEIYSISRLACMLTGRSAIQGGKVFRYNGEILTDIRKRLGI